MIDERYAMRVTGNAAHFKDKVSPRSKGSTMNTPAGGMNRYDLLKKNKT